jgi:hypothetical protein
MPGQQPDRQALLPFLLPDARPLNSQMWSLLIGIMPFTVAAEWNCVRGSPLPPTIPHGLLGVFEEFGLPQIPRIGMPGPALNSRANLPGGTS